MKQQKTETSILFASPLKFFFFFFHFRSRRNRTENQDTQWIVLKGKSYNDIGKWGNGEREGAEKEKWNEIVWEGEMVNVRHNKNERMYWELTTKIS